MRRVHGAHQRPLRDGFERGAKVAEEALAARRGFIRDPARVVRRMSEVAPRGVEQQERDDSKERQGNDRSEPRQLEEDGTAGRRSARAALRRCLCHGGILSQDYCAKYSVVSASSARTPVFMPASSR